MIDDSEWMPSTDEVYKLRDTGFGGLQTCADKLRRQNLLSLMTKARETKDYDRLFEIIEIFITRRLI